MENKPYIVYVTPNASGYITAVNSSAFLEDPTGWVEIDRGCGDRYHHAQANYLPETLYDERGIPRYRLVNGKAEPRTTQEMERDAALLLEMTAEESAETLLLEMAADHEYRICLLELDIEESEVI